MKRFLSAVLGAALLLALVPATAVAGSTSQYFHAKSPLRYHVQTYTFSTTATITDATVGVVPPGGATLRCVVLSQNAAGVGGTSWVAVPKIGTDELTTTDGGFTLAGGAGLTTGNANCPAGAITNPTGGTAPTITVANATQTGGQLVKMTITLTGTYGTAVSGSVQLFWEPRY